MITMAEFTHSVTLVMRGVAEAARKAGRQLNVFARRYREYVIRRDEWTQPHSAVRLGLLPASKVGQRRRR